MPEPPLQIRQRILQLFLEGQSVNHIVFLLHYEFNIDVVNNVIRKELREMQNFVTRYAKEHLPPDA